MQILVADDDPIAVEMLRDTLQDAGHDVVTAPDGDAAVRLLAERPVHLVITDWEMPGLTGPQLCRAIRSGAALHAGGGYCYIVLLTGRGAVAERVEGLSSGADDFLVKPFDREELLARLRSAERIVSLETREMAIFAMAKLAESRDQETGEHLERVQSYARVLTQRLLSNGCFTGVIDAEYARLIYATSPLHDIGKVGIPDSVLLKPGRLSDREFEIMKTHTTLGAETLDAAASRYPGAAFLCMARDIAASHHERYDGTGYPAGLAGEAIPLAARIVALADVYDALTSRRVYKDAFTHDVARSIVLEERGTHFAPEVVDAFVAGEAEFLRIRERYAVDRAASS
ncbi:HD-GYP domain-containing protein [Phycisphaera mikurensis]|uniref:Response regulator receiver protein n=1 Tax=Phycisphaera mikurensis (strain NBRC 102666 / KCTC 22515 / FYK2301M01) TaxID=1142394 RepID=I0IH58_PHYMF|nr:HD domain-containing phosphohydrolase [Phycisphaera mikurensis]MBB6440848.1 putative two-component system response regulator [Phycisphaera mikurensis]BAM04596.1 response regulator receiver protein [Phycisphaera mikurensis NBRC 102666]